MNKDGMGLQAMSEKKKVPSAQKRDRLHHDRHLRNHAWKSRISKAIKMCVKESSSKEEVLRGSSETLRMVQRLLDKGVKKGVISKNKAARKKRSLALSFST